MRRIAVFVIALCALGAVSFAALQVKSAAKDFGVAPAELTPIEHPQTALIVSGPRKTTIYTQETLEQLQTYSLTTSTPWRDQPARFEGVLLTDLLAEHGLGNASAIRFLAENDYEVDLLRADWLARPALIATRVDGRPLTRAERGPFYLVFPLDADPTTGGYFTTYWVWMIAEISAAPAD